MATPSYRAPTGSTRHPKDDQVTLGLQFLIPYHGIMRRNRGENALARELDQELRDVLARVVVTAPVAERALHHHMRLTDDGLYLRFSWYLQLPESDAVQTEAGWPYPEMPLLRVPEGQVFDLPYSLSAHLSWQHDEDGRKTLIDDGTLAARLYSVIARFW